MSDERVSAAVVAAQQDFKAVYKSGYNKKQGYPYAKLEDFVTAAAPVLAKHGLGLLVSATAIHQLSDRVAQSGNALRYCRILIEGKILHESGESLTVTAYGDGEDSGDKGVFKAQTGARKYLYAHVMGVATTDDPEHDGTPHADANTATPVPNPIDPPHLSEKPIPESTPKKGAIERATQAADRAAKREKGKGTHLSDAAKQAGLEYDQWKTDRVFQKDEETFEEAVDAGKTSPFEWMVKKGTRNAPRGEYCLWLIIRNEGEEEALENFVPPEAIDGTSDEIPF